MLLGGKSLELCEVWLSEDEVDNVLFQIWRDTIGKYAHLRGKHDGMGAFGGFLAVFISKCRMQLTTITNLTPDSCDVQILLRGMALTNFWTLRLIRGTRVLQGIR